MALHITENLAYWHMPKTGGMSVYKYLQFFGQKYEWINGYARHSRASNIPRAVLKGRTLFGTVRNPWDWYASLYNMANTSNDKSLLEAYGNGESNFKAVLRGLTRPLDTKPPKNFGLVFDIEKGLEDIAYEEFMSSGVGLYSFVFKWVYGNKIDVFVDTLQLEEGVGELLLLPPEILKGRVRPQNPSSIRPNYQGPNKESYDEEMIQWVYEADKSLIETFKFKPFETLAKPTINAEELFFSPYFNRL